jgi:hypothetical protein
LQYTHVPVGWNIGGDDGDDEEDEFGDSSLDHAEKGLAPGGRYVHHPQPLYPSAPPYTTGGTPYSDAPTAGQQSSDSSPKKPALAGIYLFLCYG